MNKSSQLLRFAGLGVLALIAIALIVVSVIYWRARAQLESKIGELRTAGQPVRLADLARKSIPPETNAATYLRRAKVGIEAIQKEVQAAEEAGSKADQQAMDQGHLTPEMARAVRSAIDAYPDAIALVLQATTCPDYDPQLDFTTDTQLFLKDYLGLITGSRNVIRALNYRTLLLLADGQQEAALRTSVAMLRLCRHFDHDPLLVGFLVSLACRNLSLESANRALQAGPISSDARDALQAELSQHHLADSYCEALSTERAFAMDHFREMRNWYLWAMQEQISYLDVLGREMTRIQHLNADPHWSCDLEATSAATGTFVALFLPTLQATRGPLVRAEAQLRSLQVLNAIHRRELTENGAEPKLADLGLPVAATVDPFDGQPLKIKKLPAGWLVYSVGKNLKDDGGKVHDEDAQPNDIGFGPNLPEHSAASAIKSDK